MSDMIFLRSDEAAGVAHFLVSNGDGLFNVGGRLSGDILTSLYVRYSTRGGLPETSHLLALADAADLSDGQYHLIYGSVDNPTWGDWPVYARQERADGAA